MGWGFLLGAVLAASVFGALAPEHFIRCAAAAVSLCGLRGDLRGSLRGFCCAETVLRAARAARAEMCTAHGAFSRCIGEGVRTVLLS